MFLLDTDHVSILQRGQGVEFDQLERRIQAHRKTDFYISVISFHEQALGWNNYINRAKDISSLLRGYRGFEEAFRLFASSQVLSYDEPAASMFNSLRARRVRIGTFDLRIAAMALVHNFTVLSRNLTDFRHVPDLRVEDWAQ